MTKDGPLCHLCPLKEAPGPVWGVGSPNANLVFIGMAPGPTEIETGKPFSGSSGSILTRGCITTGINRGRAWIDNIVKCFVPPGTPLNPKAVECCRPLLERGLDELRHRLVTVALGMEAFHALTGKELTFKTNKKKSNVWLRGNPYRHTTKSERCIIGTYHPAGLMRMGFLEAYLWEADLAKAKRWSMGGGHCWEETFNYRPSAQEVEEYIDVCWAKGRIGLDIETPEKVLDEEEVVGRKPTPISVVGISHQLGSCLGVPPDLMPRLERLFRVRNPPLRVFAFNWGFDGYHLRTNGFNVDACESFDLMLALNLLYSDCKPKDLGMALSIFGDMPYHKNLMKSDPDVYNARDTYGALYAGELAEEELGKLALTKLFWSHEMSLIPIVEELRTQGACCDITYAERAELTLGLKLKQYEQWWKEKIPHIDWSSPAQLVSLFRAQGLPIKMAKRKKKDKTTYESPTVDEEALEDYRDKYKSNLAALVLEMRKLKKASDFTHIYSSDSRSHSQYKIHGQVAGRLQSKEPDLQNIPERLAGIEPRRIIISDSLDDILIAADFSQIELRLYAKVSGDEAFLRAFARGDYIYGQLYEEIYGKPFFEPGQPRIKLYKAKTVEPGELLVAKSGPLGLIYGRQVNSLMRLGVSKQKAEAIYRHFFLEHHWVGEFHNKLMFTAEKMGYVRNAFGRIRRFPNPKGQREQVLSFPGQANAADVLRCNALLPLHRGLHDYGARLLLTVHDSILVNCPRPALRGCVSYIKDTMEAPIPQLDGFWIPVEISVGPNWNDLTPYEEYEHRERTTGQIQKLSQRLPFLSESPSIRESDRVDQGSPG